MGIIVSGTASIRTRNVAIGMLGGSVRPSQYSSSNATASLSYAAKLRLGSESRMCVLLCCGILTPSSDHKCGTNLRVYHVCGIIKCHFPKTMSAVPKTLSLAISGRYLILIVSGTCRTNSSRSKWLQTRVRINTLICTLLPKSATLCELFDWRNVGGKSAYNVQTESTASCGTSALI